MAEGPIPWSAMVDYCRFHDIDGEQREDLCFHVRAVDNAYLKWRTEKREAERAKATKQPKR